MREGGEALGFGVFVELDRSSVRAFLVGDDPSSVTCWPTCVGGVAGCVGDEPGRLVGDVGDVVDPQSAVPCGEVGSAILNGDVVDEVDADVGDEPLGIGNGFGGWVVGVEVCEIDNGEFG